CVAGSPASMRSTNCTPFTTRPSCTSRQAMIRLVSMRFLSLPFQKIPQNLQSGGTGLFRMKLYAHHITALHCCRERLNVPRDSCGVIGNRRLVGMSEVHKLARLNTRKQSRIVAHLKRVPPHMRHLLVA